MVSRGWNWRHGIRNNKYSIDRCSKPKSQDCFENPSTSSYIMEHPDSLSWTVQLGPGWSKNYLVLRFENSSVNDSWINSAIRIMKRQLLLGLLTDHLPHTMELKTLAIGSLRIQMLNTRFLPKTFWVRTNPETFQNFIIQYGNGQEEQNKNMIKYALNAWLADGLGDTYIDDYYLDNPKKAQLHWWDFFRSIQYDAYFLTV